MALDREDTLKKAEKLLRQGRIDHAIAEYLRVVEDQPRDWNTANTLGDLYARANQPARAVEQYARIADHFAEDGFYPKAAALYKKILKLVPDQEAAQLQLADVSVRLGLLKDAKTHYGAVAARRRTRGDARGADEIVVLLGDVDPADIPARMAAARVLAALGNEAGASAKLRELHADLVEKGRDAEAMQALQEAVRLNPADTDGRALLARVALAAGNAEAARGHLDRETAGSDPALLMALAEVELRETDLGAAREVIAAVLTLDPGRRDAVVALGWTLCGAQPDAAFVCAEAAADAAIAAAEFEQAAGVLQAFVQRVPGYIPALLKLVEVCVDGGLEAAMYDTQAQLADAYLSVSQGAEARVIAEDLVAREPWEAAHIERFRRALIMLKVPEPDNVIAERLNGESPFTAMDHFSGPLDTAVEVPPVPEPSRTPPPAAEPPVPASPPRAAARVGADQEAEIDLTSILGELKEDAAHVAIPAPGAPASLDEAFQDFRSDAARKGAADQSAQHMKLARTYMEMGMLDEATAALKTAAGSPIQRFEAASMLGRLYREHRDLPHAIEWFERAAEVPAPAAEAGRALLYDFAITLEEAGETARAIAVLLDLAAEAGHYRDAAERANRLGRVQTGG
ncbi:MAG: tetratricopeptide repeat protein [Acidobacteriota bacterium]|nr:tetratricopeptide repeat protein [Acidobacteriota bacterium]